MVTHSNKPIISVAIVTYNHEKYIAQTLDSVFMQKGPFDLEIIIGEDSSTDSTYSILQQYKETHPQVITILKERGNMGALKNMARVLKACTGDYIAILDGDDYWTNENKLEKQLNFLKTNDRFAACQHETSRVDENGNLLQATLWEEKIAATVTQKDLFKSDNLSQTSTWLFRSACIRPMPPFLENCCYDRILAFRIADFGNWGNLSEVMAAYRIHNSGIFSKQNEERKTEQLIEIYETLWNHSDYQKKYRLEISERLRYLYKNTASFQLKKKSGSGFFKAVFKATFHTHKLKDKLYLLKDFLIQRANNND